MNGRHDDGMRVPDLLVERYRLGEMNPDELAAFNERLRTDDELRRRLAALDASDEAIRQSYPPAMLAAQIRQRLEAGASAGEDRRAAWLFGLQWKTVAGLAAVILLAVVIAPSMLDLPGGIKGLEPSLVLFRKVVDGSETLADGARVHQGDLIRVGYRAAGQAYGIILSIDGRGIVTTHLPADGTQAARLSAADQVLLDSAYELDDAPRWERFYFVTSSEPFDTATVLGVARRAAASGADGLPSALRLSSRFKQASVLLVKEPRPGAAIGSPAPQARALDRYADAVPPQVMALSALAAKPCSVQITR